MNRNFFEKQMLVDGFNKDSLNKLLDSKDDENAERGESKKHNAEDIAFACISFGL